MIFNLIKYFKKNVSIIQLSISSLSLSSRSNLVCYHEDLADHMLYTGKRKKWAPPPPSLSSNLLCYHEGVLPLLYMSCAPVKLNEWVHSMLLQLFRGEGCVTFCINHRNRPDLRKRYGTKSEGACQTHKNMNCLESGFQPWWGCKYLYIFVCERKKYSSCPYFS